MPYPLASDMHHGPRGGNKIGFADMMAFFFLLDHATNEFPQFVVGSPAAHLAVEVMVPNRKQAGADFAVGCNANAAAMSAERMRHRRDDSNFPNAVFETVAPRGLAAGVWNFNQLA